MASNSNSWSTGKIALISAVCGVAVLLLLMFLFTFSLWTSLFWGVVIGFVVFFILTLAYGGADDAAGYSPAAGAGVAGTSGAAADGAASAPEAPVAPEPPVKTEAEAEAPVVAEAAEETQDASDDGADGEADDSADDGGDDGADDGAEAPAVVPSKELAGEAELAERKGEWKYEGGESGADDVAAGGAGVQDAVDEASATPDFDKDGVQEGTNEGTKPEMLSAAREGGADNLKEIKGVGPKMETMLNEMGVYHFDQVAGWTAQEVAWVDANLKGFKGRVSRDGWVDQAKILAAGGETEFSTRVDKGEVY
jgi:predicted flap endonuclease-1-like 5' DNA nuclease